jgi:probable LLM family oxidoreductase
MMELGLATFGDIAPDLQTGRTISPAERLRNLLEEIELADQVGLDVFGVGEHHRPDYVVSAPAVVLAAAAARTKNIRLTSAVTVLSSDDPVRVFQQFATVDLVSNGRAEIIVGRGSFVESFPLFGFPLELYDDLFSERLELLLEIRRTERVSWSGKHRPSIDDLGVYPRPIQDPLPIWIGIGGTPQSAVRAGRLGLPMTMAIIGGMPERFNSFVEKYRTAGERAGHDVSKLALGVNTHGFVADTSQAARDEFFAPYSAMMNKIGRERGWGPMTRGDFDALASLRGALAVGSPQEVVDKILYQHEIFGHQRFLAQMSVGSMPHRQVLRGIELFGTKVAPAVRAATASVDSKTEITAS